MIGSVETKEVVRRGFVLDDTFFIVLRLIYIRPLECVFFTVLRLYSSGLWDNSRGADTRTRPPFVLLFTSSISVFL